MTTSWRLTPTQRLHVLALSVLLIGTLGCQVAIQSRTAQVQQAPAQGLVAPTGTAELQAPAQHTSVVIPVPRRVSFPPAVERWRSLIRATADAVQGVTGLRFDDDLLLALIAVESGGDPVARSARGALGLTQVKPGTFRDLQARYGRLLAPGSLEQPTINAMAGALYLAECARIFGTDLTNPNDLVLLLHAYNMGPRAAAEWREADSRRHETNAGVPMEDRLPTESIEHAERILAIYEAATSATRMPPDRLESM